MRFVQLAAETCSRIKTLPIPQLGWLRLHVPFEYSCVGWIWLWMEIDEPMNYGEVCRLLWTRWQNRLSRQPGSSGASWHELTMGMVQAGHGWPWFGSWELVLIFFQGFSISLAISYVNYVCIENCHKLSHESLGFSDSRIFDRHAAPQLCQALWKVRRRARRICQHCTDPLPSRGWMLWPYAAKLPSQWCEGSPSTSLGWEMTRHLPANDIYVIRLVA